MPCLPGRKRRLRLFCDVDNVTYGECRKIGFARTQTLGWGGCCCDFHFFRRNDAKRGAANAGGKNDLAYPCTLEKEGFVGTFYPCAVPTEKAVILVGGSEEKRPFVEKRARALRNEGFHVLALGYYLYSGTGRNGCRLHRKDAGTVSDHGKEIPGRMPRGKAGKLGKARLLF